MPRADVTAGGQERVAVIGLGYVGCVTAACLASLGHDVVGIDRDVHKVRIVDAGAAPFYEPGLQELVAAERASGRFRVTTVLADALRDADLALVCVGTPSSPNGSLDVKHLARACGEIATALSGRPRPLIVALRSTVLPGTCDELVDPLLERCGRITVVANPEFLREGRAIDDFLHPPFVIVGGEHAAASRVAALYRTLGAGATIVSRRTAELIKYACNAFHAVKVSFANELGTLASSSGADADELMRIFCGDDRLNLSAAYLRPGLPFGGSCLPKDLRAIVQLARSREISVPLLGAVLPSNDAHLERAIERVRKLPGRLGIFGLAFKADTDDVRESPVVTLIEQLLAKGRRLRVFDPCVRFDALHGRNLEFLLRSLPHIRRLLMTDLERWMAWADCVVIAQRPSAEHRAMLTRHRGTVFDLTQAAGVERAPRDGVSHVLSVR